MGMGIVYKAELTCDHHPRCAERMTAGVIIEMDRGCSPFGGGMCKGELAADIYGSGWNEFPEGKVCCPRCMAEPDRFEPESIARKLREYDWGPLPRASVWKDWTAKLLAEPGAWEATTDGGYPRCGWGKVCGFEIRSSFGGQPCPHVRISGWMGGSWHSLSMVSELRRRVVDGAEKP